MASNPGISFQGSQNTTCTVPEENRCHYITDDELMRLGEMRKEPVMEIFLCSIGAFVGALIPALSEVSKVVNAPDTVTLSGFLTLMIAAMMFAVALVSGFLWHQRTKTHEGMLTTIRNRPRVPVKLAYDNVA